MLLYNLILESAWAAQSPLSSVEVFLLDVSVGQHGSVRTSLRVTSYSSLRGDRPYERLDITGTTGSWEAQKVTLHVLGAVEGPVASSAEP